MTLGICLLAGAIEVFVPAQRFTLAWMHSIEKIRWEEDYVVEPRQLRLTEARIRGSGAGMEPPPDAKLVEGVWHYRPQLDRFPKLNLARSRYTRDYELCLAAGCRELSRYVPIEAGPTTVMPCRRQE